MRKDVFLVDECNISERGGGVMFELLGRLWTAVTGGSAKPEKDAIQAKAKAKAEGQATHNADTVNTIHAANNVNTASGKGTVSSILQKNGMQNGMQGKYNELDNQKKNNEQIEQNTRGKGQADRKPVRRQYAGRLPICAGCMNIGSCAGFFPGCGCYGNSHDTVNISAGDWQSQSNVAKGRGIASPEFAAWCAFMGYAVAERYWAEYEDVWNYYEAALQEYGSEYEAFNELDELNEYDEFVDDIDDVDDEYTCDNGYDRNDAAYDDCEHDSNFGGYDDYDSGRYGDDYY